MKKEIIIDIITALLVLLFSYTAFSKFLDHGNFAVLLYKSPLFTFKPLAILVSWFVPVMESVIVLGLLTSFRLKALYASVILLFLFELYIMGMVLSGLHLPCSCGGVIAQLSWKAHIPFNAFFIMITCYAIRLCRIKTIFSSGLKTARKDLSRA